jgi:hypothetical protein
VLTLVYFWIYSPPIILLLWKTGRYDGMVSSGIMFILSFMNCSEVEKRDKQQGDFVNLPSFFKKGKQTIKNKTF